MADQIIKYKLGKKEITAIYNEYNIAQITRECFEELIAKQIPRKPKLKLFGFDKSIVAYCPYCNNAFGEVEPKECINVHTMKWYYRNGRKESHCGECGQSIDWSE